MREGPWRSVPGGSKVGEVVVILPGDPLRYRQFLKLYQIGPQYRITI